MGAAEPPGDGVRLQGRIQVPFSELPVSSYKVEQQRVRYRDRDFHFVSYEGHPANERKGESAEPPMWYLMGPGKRWPAVPHVVGQPAEELEVALVGWIKEQGLGRAVVTRRP